MGKAVMLMKIANQHFWKARHREPDYIEKGMKKYKCSTLR
ncbi:hypothetical protein BOTU111921_08895 [Bordetella tumbae]